MKSAYGLKIPEPDGELTRVGPGTPCGELMRRYWQPVCLSADLKDLPKPVKILGEELIAFRDGQGRAGLLFFRCSHRGASLEYGRVEERGLRCCYHGWLYDVEGNVVEMPLEPAPNPIFEATSNSRLTRCVSLAGCCSPTWGRWSGCRSFRFTMSGKLPAGRSKRAWGRGSAARSIAIGSRPKKI